MCVFKKSPLESSQRRFEVSVGIVWHPSLLAFFGPGVQRAYTHTLKHIYLFPRVDPDTPLRFHTPFFFSTEGRWSVCTSFRESLPPVHKGECLIYSSSLIASSLLCLCISGKLLHWTINYCCWIRSFLGWLITCNMGYCSIELDISNCFFCLFVFFSQHPS